MTLKGTFGEYVVIDPVKLAEWQRSPDGPTVRYLLEQGEKVKTEAKRLVGVYDPPDAYSRAHRQRRPGTLRDSIVKRIVDINGAPACIVGSEDPIALWHHEGTRPHIIEPRTTTRNVNGGKGNGRWKQVTERKPYLVFFWPKLGQVVAFPRVNHPGTKPNRFLVNALRVIGGRAA